ncbi:hypothetical protein HPP92_022070 [Vanilla planifolia]|uniref:Non-haem dioxygenase N-terminal domain-containing protein n=1 Tax=Vanilla planifolia TaxID=51239 RepID=A0A835PWQ5_VANPL|nr:hypothetical protein HPP92_022070 [Vanilla planifolia]
MAGSLRLPLVDLASTDRTAAAGMIRQACLEYGFFYLTNHGIDSEVFWLVFGESKKFFCLSFDEKMQLNHSEYHRGYTPLYAENLDPSTKAKGDLKESFYIGPSSSTNDVNQWPSEESLPIWRSTMVSYYEKVLSVGKKLLALIALALNLDERFFEINGALSSPMGFLRLLHYPGKRINGHDNGKMCHRFMGHSSLTLEIYWRGGLTAYSDIFKRLSEIMLLRVEESVDKVIVSSRTTREKNLSLKKE